MNSRTRSLADIRVIIGAVLSIIGLYLLICSTFVEEKVINREGFQTGHVNANLWAGLGLVTVAVFMILWWVFSPVQGSPGNKNLGFEAD